ncbi:MAG: hypothetical protein AAGF48_10545 [Pseudomonadota bacterium]
MHVIPVIAALALLLTAAPAHAQSDMPELTGKWTCEPAPMLIRGEWTELVYTFEIAEQRGPLFKGTFKWTLSKEADVKGELVGGEKALEGEWTALGVISTDNTTVEIVSYKDLQRHSGTLEDANTIRFVHSKVGDDAWVSRSTCER